MVADAVSLFASGVSFLSLTRVTVSLTRIALKDFTFHDGTVVPKGSLVSAASITRHLNDDIYPNAHQFDGFRFAKIREAEGQGTTNQFVATSNDYIAFGHGKHAW
jgi:cytochrome P450